MTATLDRGLPQASHPCNNRWAPQFQRPKMPSRDTRNTCRKPLQQLLRPNNTL